MNRRHDHDAETLDEDGDDPVGAADAAAIICCCFICTTSIIPVFYQGNKHELVTEIMTKAFWRRMS